MSTQIDAYMGHVSDDPALNKEVIVSFSRDDATSVEVFVFKSDDGATVVQIDTHGDDRLRVNVNDGAIYDHGVESGVDYLSRDSVCDCSENSTTPSYEHVDECRWFRA